MAVHLGELSATGSWDRSYPSHGNIPTAVLPSCPRQLVIVLLRCTSSPSTSSRLTSTCFTPACFKSSASSTHTSASRYLHLPVPHIHTHPASTRCSFTRVPRPHASAVASETPRCLSPLRRAVSPRSAGVLSLLHRRAPLSSGVASRLRPPAGPPSPLARAPLPRGSLEPRSTPSAAAEAAGGATARQTERSWRRCWCWDAASGRQPVSCRTTQPLQPLRFPGSLAKAQPRSRRGRCETSIHALVLGLSPAVSGAGDGGAIFGRRVCMSGEVLSGSMTAQLRRMCAGFGSYFGAV